jgi:biotin carboxyl carrier protein
VTDRPDLTPEDVQEILRLIDESQFDELELETPRFTIRFTRGAPPAEDVAPESAAADGLVEVASPMVGTFYRAPSPGAPPFVEVGSAVESGTQVCIIEVMKLMNSVVAGVRGVVAEVCAQNGAPVQYGDVLFRVQAHA